MGGKEIVSTSPVTGDKLGSVPIRDAAHVADAMLRARAAQVAWAALTVHERCEQVFKLRDTLVDSVEEIVDLIVAESGKPRMEALTHEVLTTADLATYYARRAAKMLAPREIDLHLFKHRRSYVHYVPRGVIGIIAPWNFPFGIAMRDVITALVSGNAAVLKPSEVTPLIALKGKEIYDRAGLPPDLFQVVTGDGSTGAALVEARPDMVVLTGSVATGRKVAAACGERLIPCTMELGGKAAAIVCDDAHLERAARAITFGGFTNSGQVCIGVERVYACDGIHDALLSRVCELVSELRQGPPEGHDVDLGAVCFAHQLEVAEALIKDASDKGAKVEIGGARVDRAGQFFEPTVLSGCDHNMDVMREEIFGPVLPFMRVADEEEAVALANDSHLGLMGYVFTKDRGKGRRLAESVRAGTVMVNDVLSAYASPEAPFGGIKDSGFGAVHGPEGLRAMCELRHVSYDRVGLVSREPFWFPYGERTYKATTKALKLLFRRGSPVQKILDLF